MLQQLSVSDGLEIGSNEAVLVILVLINRALVGGLAMLERKDVFPLFLELVPSVFKERIETHKTFI